MLMWSLLACHPSPGPVPSQQRDGDPELPEVDGAIERLMERGHVPGVSAAVVVDGRVAWAKAYGVRSTATGAPVELDTPFLTASVSKTLIAVAGLRLRDEGAYTLTDAVHVPFPVRHPDHPDREITYDQLYRHASGILDNWDVLEPDYVDGDSPIPLGTYLEAYLVPGGAEYHPRNWSRWAPGEGEVYSNIGAALLAHAVEVHTGEPFDAHTEREILEPLGMDRSGWHIADFDPDRVASPHVRHRGQDVPVPHFGWPDYPDGSLRASATDLGVFLAAVMERDPALLDPDTMDEMMPAPGEEQGLVWFRQPLDDRGLLGHDGSDTGSAAEMFYDPETGVGFVLLMNAEPRYRWIQDAERALLDAF